MTSYNVYITTVIFTCTDQLPYVILSPDALFSFSSFDNLKIS